MNFKLVTVQDSKGNMQKTLINLDTIQEIGQSQIIGHCRFVIINSGGQMAYDVVMSFPEAVKEFGNTNMLTLQ